MLQHTLTWPESHKTLKRRRRSCTQPDVKQHTLFIYLSMVHFRCGQLNEVESIGFRSLRGGSAPLSTDAGGDSNMELGRRYCACPRLHGRRKAQRYRE